MSDTPTYWMIVTSPQNFARTRELGFTLQGIKSRHGKKAAKMQAGDRLLWYLTGIQSFAGTATITGPAYEDHTIVWTSKPGEDYPWRFPIRADTILDADSAVKAADLLPGLGFVKKWPIEHWHLAFQGNVHTLPAADFDFIERSLQTARAAA
ncbi:MAG TPA: EVE domain-containing protein [Chloroflexota bacterium]|nr:EVE domain-containing protein [Chloroflexota bacterium]